jgi:PadR family transcriptional regulator, regulatory protein PadR
MDIAKVLMLGSYAMAKGEANGGAKIEVLQGTLDLIVLQTLDSMGPQHGYGIARRIEQVSDDILRLNEGTVYAALMRLQQRRWISATWGTSENNRKAKFYAITSAGRRQLAREVETWDRLASLIARLRGAEQG